MDEGKIIIDGLELIVKINVKRMKTINMRIRLIDNKYYLIINSFKKLKNTELNELINRNLNGIKRLVKKCVICPLKDDEDIILGKIYKKQDITKELLTSSYQQIIDLFNHYKEIFGRPNTKLKFWKMKSRWGECFYKEDLIKLTTHIVHVPLSLINYVIVHEFCHFTHPNHSKDFYDLVKKYTPDYKISVKELKNYSYVLK